MPPRSALSEFARRSADAVGRFFLEPASATPLAALRIGLAGVLLVQGLSLAADALDLYGPAAVAGWDVFDPTGGPTDIHPLSPRVRTFAGLLTPFGLTAEAATRLIFTAYLAALAGLLVGWRTRTAAATAWVSHLALNNAAAATAYGVDLFAHIGLFYCVVFPVGAALSVDATRGGAAGPSSSARLGLRTLQLHLCVVYLASAVEKASGPQWWDGEAIWRATTLPELARFDMMWLAAAPWLAVLAGWGTLAVEAGYALLVWPRRTRTAIVVATIGLHAGIGLFMSLPFFAAVMIVLTTSAFLVPAEPAAVRNVAARFAHLRRRFAGEVLASAASPVGPIRTRPAS